MIRRSPERYFAEYLLSSWFISVPGEVGDDSYPFHRGFFPGHMYGLDRNLLMIKMSEFQYSYS
jgi:hypothetical protein